MIEFSPYVLCVVIISVGLYGVAINKNYFKKLISLGIMQAGVILLFIAIAKVKGGAAPILPCENFAECGKVVANPLPHVLMLTAIVVGVATLAVGLSLIVKIKSAYSSIDDEGRND